MLMGDLNFVSPGGGRLDARTGEITVYLVTGYHEIIADGYSRRRFHEGESHQLARLDRVYIHSPVHELETSGCHAKCMLPLDPRLMTSDNPPWRFGSRRAPPLAEPRSQCGWRGTRGSGN